MEKASIFTDKFIIDVCCGNRMFWFDKKNPNVLFIDKRARAKGFVKERPNFNIAPDVLGDFKKIGLPANHYKLVVWDPPHMKTLNETSIMAKKYGCLNAQTWQWDLKKGFKECWRVLDDFGILIFKWCETEISTKEVLALFPETPLFGHPIGSKSNTQWFCFMKIPKGARAQK